MTNQGSVTNKNTRQKKAHLLTCPLVVLALGMGVGCTRTSDNSAARPSTAYDRGSSASTNPASGSDVNTSSDNPGSVSGTSSSTTSNAPSTATESTESKTQQDVPKSDTTSQNVNTVEKSKKKKGKGHKTSNESASHNSSYVHRDVASTNSSNHSEVRRSVTGGASDMDTDTDGTSSQKHQNRAPASTASSEPSSSSGTTSGTTEEGTAGGAAAAATSARILGPGAYASALTDWNVEWANRANK